MTETTATTHETGKSNTEPHKLAPKRLLPALNNHLEASGLTDTTVAGAHDDQNGLTDQSLWVTFADHTTEKRNEIIDELTRLGLDIFLAPKDSHTHHRSTYGIPVDTLTDLFPGDILLLDHTHHYRVTNVANVSDGGPWTRKSRLTLAHITRLNTGTDRLLAVDHTENNPTPTLYTTHSTATSGYMAMHDCNDIHRHPRYDTLAIDP